MLFECLHTCGCSFRRSKIGRGDLKAKSCGNEPKTGYPRAARGIYDAYHLNHCALENIRTLWTFLTVGNFILAHYDRTDIISITSVKGATIRQAITYVE